MQKIRRLIKNNTPVLVLIVIGLISRLINLTLLPIFTDESIYIYWAKLIQSTQSQWFISLTDGKPPLLIWMIGGFLQILPDSMYLIAGRLPSVMAGVLSIVAIYKLSEILFRSQKVALFSGVLYIISPFTLIYDRLALFDSLLSSMLLWSTYFAIRTYKTLKWTDAVLWGFFLGLAFLSKPTALMFWVLLPICIGILAWKKTLIKNWRRILLLSAIALVSSQLIQAIQRFSSVYFRVAEKNSQFQVPLNELLRDPFQLVQSNLIGLFSWFISYNTIPIFILGLFAFSVLLFKKPREGLVLLILWVVPILGLATIGREIFPRYIVFVTPYFIIPISFLVVWLWEKGQFQKIFSILIILIIIFFLTPFSYLIIFSPEKAPFPRTDYRQLVGDHTSGYGLEKVFEFIDDESGKGKVFMVTQGTFGLYPYAFNLRYWDNNDVEIIPSWPLLSPGDIPIAGDRESEYIILKENREGDIPAELGLELVFKAEKPSGKYPILVTKLR